jgi:type I restriction enzyme S subunit
MVRLGDCVQPVKNWNPLRIENIERFSYIDIASVNQVRKKILDAKSIECKNAPSRARQLVATNDVLVSTVRPNLNAVAIVQSSLHQATASTGFCVIRANPFLLDSSYLFSWVRASAFIDDMVSKATGASYPAVSDKIIFDSEIPLPPLPEQKRIAAILDQADAIRRDRELAIAKLDQLAQSIFVEMFGEIESNSKKLPKVLLKDACLRITDGTHQSPEWQSAGVPFLFISNIVNGNIVLDTDKYISNETYNDLTKRCPIEIGDILYTTVGSYGNVAIVKTTEKFCFQRHIAHIKPDSNIVNPEFISAMLYSKCVKRQVDRVAKGAAQKTVNLGDINKLVIFRPSLALQQEFTNRIKALEQLKADNNAALAKHNTLFASLQHSAFTGQL